MDIGIKLTGHVHVEKWRRDKGKTFETEFDNLVLDVGWQEMKTRIYSGGGHRPNYLFLGSGATEPAATDSGLEAVSGTLAGKASHGPGPGDYGSGTDGNGYRYSQVNMIFSYGEGEAEGTWTELGLSYDSSYTLPYNRALFRDENGNPISITVLLDEFLTITISLRIYVPVYGLTGSTAFNGQAISFTYGFNSNFGSWGSYGGWGYGLPRYMRVNGSSGMQFSNTAYDEASLTRDFSITIDPGSELTITQVTGWSRNDNFGLYEHLIINFDPDIVKPETHKIDNFTMSVSYSRVA